MTGLPIVPGLSRRHLLMSASAALATLGAPRALRAQATPHVVVVGGGFAGATCAKYLKLWGGDALRVTLIDPRRSHVSCVMSNLVLTRELSLGDLSFDLTALEAYGVEVVRNKVTGVDPDARTVALKSGDAISYDRLVLSGGVSFRRVDGWDPKKMPHAWIAGGQTRILRDQLEAMPAGGHFILTIPLSPYRCPPGPYERACTVAALMRARGGGGRVTVLDANPDIQAERATFNRAFFDLYSDIIDYRTNVILDGVDSDTGAVYTLAEAFQGDVVNILPTHRASGLVRKAGLVPKGSNWAPVDPLSYESTLDGFENVHVIGDSQGTGQPKSGHMANAQAKICADAILRLLNDEPIDTPERMASVTTNSACFSPITLDEASWLTAAFAYDVETDQMRLVQGSLAEARSWSRGNFRDMYDWADNLWADTFK
jgi:sulfide dehydrogenase [flavocytochrome c] flavoprotein subunit